MTVHFYMTSIRPNFSSGMVRDSIVCEFRVRLVGSISSFTIPERGVKSGAIL